jgi:protein involved in polysaccharide export with SLBB domain
MSSNRIVEILQDEPELLATFKYQFIQRLQRLRQRATESAPPRPDSWESLDPANITDDAFFSRIERDADLRIMISSELTRRGYNEFDEADMDCSVPAGTSATVPSRTPQTEEKTADGEASRSMRQLMELQPRCTPRPQEGLQSKMLHRHTPYPTLPSLRDLYSQYPAMENMEKQLKRFGSNTFVYGTGNVDLLPMDLPAGPDYVLGPGDGLTLNIWGSVSQRLTRTIDRQGQVTLPEAGPIMIAGFTITRAQEVIRETLSTHFKNIRAEISLQRLRTVRVYVVGDVQRPGAYDISSLSTPLNALYEAGGPTSRGSLRIMRHLRGNKLVREIDLYDFLLHGVRNDVDRLENGDTLLVPSVGPQVTITGMVRRPAIYELKGETTLSQVLEYAGGVLVSATLREINVERIEAHQRHTMLSLRLGEPAPQQSATSGSGSQPAAGSQAELASAPAAVGATLPAVLKSETGSQSTAGIRNQSQDFLATFRVQDGDRVLVSPILPYNEQAVYLQGHVFRPGKFPYRDGMTMNDLLRSYQDIMPEPADHAELIRLQPPDFRPLTVNFNLPEVLGGDNVINLRPFDVIRVFSRYEVDSPKVTIYGEVLRPGEYPLTQGMTAAGLVTMAGGFKRSAYRGEADLASYVVRNGEKIQVSGHAVEIGKALEGDKKADARLKTGDILSIRQLTGWKDVGASVVLRGEVAHTGSYGIAQGERLSSVLKRAGGLRETAYPAGAVLERVQVRELAEKTRMDMIRRLESTPITLQAGSTTQAMQQQQQQVLTGLRGIRAGGRQVIQISGNISEWENTSADVEMRAGDVLTVPKRPTFVTVSGQVYNPTAITFEPGKSAGWYLREAGGPTSMANRKSIFVVRANGSVIGRTGRGPWKSNVLEARLQAGDTVVVPEKIIGGTPFWKDLIGMSQTFTTIALTAAVALH